MGTLEALNDINVLNCSPLLDNFLKGRVLGVFLSSQHFVNP